MLVAMLGVCVNVKGELQEEVKKKDCEKVMFRTWRSWNVDVLDLIGVV